MADKPLKSITFPGLADKYMIPEIDLTLTQQGEAADAKKTGDEISGVKNTLNQLETDIAVVVDGNMPSGGATAGQYLLLKNSTISGRSDGLYTVASGKTVSQGTAIDGTYLAENSPITGGGFNAIVGEKHAIVPESGFVLDSTGQNYYCKIGNVVFVNFKIGINNQGTTFSMFVLPEGFRPANQVNTIAWRTGTICLISVGSDGNVLVRGVGGEPLSSGVVSGNIAIIIV